MGGGWWKGKNKNGLDRLNKPGSPQGYLRIKPGTRLERDLRMSGPWYLEYPTKRQRRRVGMMLLLRNRGRPEIWTIRERVKDVRQRSCNGWEITGDLKFGQPGRGIIGPG